MEPKKGVENELDRVRTLFGHDDLVRWAAPAADISRAEQHPWSEWAEKRKINPEAHGDGQARRTGGIASLACSIVMRPKLACENSS
jgi:hypothetical protein